MTSDSTQTVVLGKQKLFLLLYWMPWDVAEIQGIFGTCIKHC